MQKPSILPILVHTEGVDTHLTDNTTRNDYTKHDYDHSKKHINELFLNSEIHQRWLAGCAERTEGTKKGVY